MSFASTKFDFAERGTCCSQSAEKTTADPPRSKTTLAKFDEASRLREG